MAFINKVYLDLTYKDIQQAVKHERRTLTIQKIKSILYDSNIKKKECNHLSHWSLQTPILDDYSGLYPALMAPPEHGHIPNTNETGVYVYLIIQGTMSLHMIGLDIIELYTEILKHMVPKCYNIWNLVENVLRSIKRVKNPNYMTIMKQLKIEKRKKSGVPRKATPEDFGIVSSKRNGRK